VHDSPVVRRLQDGAQAAEQSPDPVDIEWAVARQHGIEPLAIHEFHDRARAVRSVHRGFVEFDGVRVAEPGQAVDFLLEVAAIVGVRSEFFGKDLDDDGSIRVALAGQIGATHPAFPQ
jgi:hypothetical protein